MSSSLRSSRAPLVPFFVLVSAALLACGGDDAAPGGGGPAAGGSAGATGGGAGGQKAPLSVATAIAFAHQEQALPGFTYATGLQPMNSPVQVGLTVSVAGEASIVAEAYALEAKVLKGRKGSGHVKIKGAFVLDGQVKGELAGFKYDGDIPGLKDEKFEFGADAAFEPFSIGKEVVAVAKVPAKKLPDIPLPGGLPGHIEIELLEGSTVEIGFTGTCADHDEATAVYQGKVRRGGTVKFSTKLVLEVPFTPKQELPLPEMTLPIAGIATPVDLGKPKAVVGTPPADAGETASPACRGPGAAGSGGAAGVSGAAGTAGGGGLSSGGAAGQAGQSQGGTNAGGQSQGGGGQAQAGQAGQTQGGQSQGGNGQGGQIVGGSGPGGSAQGGNEQGGSDQGGNGQGGFPQGGQAGTGQGGSGQAGTGQGGSGQAGTGQGGSGQAGTGQGGSGQGGTGQGGSGQAGSAQGGQSGSAGAPGCVAVSAKDFVVFSSEMVRGNVSPNVAGAGADHLTIGFYAAPDGGTSSFTLGTGNNANYGSCDQCVLLRADDGTRYFAQTGTLSLTKQSLAQYAFSSGKLTNVRLTEVTIDPTTFTSTPVVGGRCFDLAETTWTVPSPACDDGGSSYGTGSSACNACLAAETSPQACCGAVSSACDDSTACLALSACIQGCGTQACVDACGQNNPEGVSVYNAEKTCLFGDGAVVLGACSQVCN